MYLSAMYRLCWYCKAFLQYGGVKQWWDGKTSYFVAKCVNFWKTVGDTSKVTIYDKLDMRFRLTPRSMTLYDLELYKFKFSDNFSGCRRFRTRQQLNEWRYTSIVSDNVVSTSNWSNLWHAFASRRFVSDSWAFLLSFRTNTENANFQHIEHRWYQLKR